MDFNGDILNYPEYLTRMTGEHLSYDHVCVCVGMGLRRGVV